MDITFSGLQKWYVSLFEKYGWVMLSKQNDPLNQTKVDEYARKIEKWLELANNKLRSSSVTGLHKEDIEIMIRNMNKLNNILHNRLPVVAKGGSLDFESDGFIVSSNEKEENNNKKNVFYDIYGFC